MPRKKERKKEKPPSEPQLVLEPPPGLKAETLRGRKKQIWEFLWILPGIGALHRLARERYPEDPQAADRAVFPKTMENLDDYLHLTPAELTIGLAIFWADYKRYRNQELAPEVRANMDCCAEIPDAFWGRVIRTLKRRAHAQTAEAESEAGPAE